MLNQVYTVSEVAALRECSPQYVRLLLKNGFWGSEARKSSDGVWLVTNPLKGMK